MKTDNLLRHISLPLLMLLTLMCSVSVPAHAGVGQRLITSSSQLWCNASETNKAVLRDYNFKKDYSDTQSWDSGISGGYGAFIQVNLQKPDWITDDQYLVVHVKRSSAGSKDTQVYDQPTCLAIYGSTTGSSSSLVGPLAYAYLLDRGPYTDEFSDRIPGNLLKGYQYLRFVATATNISSKDATPATRMQMRALDLLLLNEGDTYTSTWRDRFSLVGDYVDIYKDYSFANTRGIVDEPNKVTGWTDRSADVEKLKEVGINFPEYDLLDSSKDKDITSGNRQRTHVTEHTVYAIAGDPVVLYPYYQFASSGEDAYCDRFGRWYDYRTGGSLDVIDNLIDPTCVARTDGHGIIGGSHLPLEKNQILIHTVEDYIKFVALVNGGDTDLNAKLTHDLDFKGYTNIEPIGTEQNKYCGTFNGNGYRIKNLVMDYPTRDNVGMFGWITNGVHITNIVLDEPVFKGRSLVAPIAHFHYKGSIEPTCRINKIMVLDGTVYAYGEATPADKDIDSTPGAANASLLLGMLDAPYTGTNSSRLEIESCAVSGTVSSAKGDKGEEDHNAAICAWVTGAWSNPRFKNIWSIAEVKGYATVKKSADSEEVYKMGYVNGAQISRIWGYHNRCLESHDFYLPVDNDKVSGFLPLDSNGVLNVNSDDFCHNKQVMEGSFEKSERNYFCMMKWPGVTYTEEEKKADRNLKDGYIYVCKSTFHDNPPHKQQWYSEVMTFFVPRTVESSQADQPYLYGDGNKEEDEYLIAADFSQTFDQSLHLDTVQRKITEPIIAYRHLFRIKDGKKFADEFSGSVQANKDYIASHKRFISAPSDTLFQIRLDEPIPINRDSRSNIYYKKSDTEYRRVCSMDIDVYQNGDKITDPGFLASMKSAAAKDAVFEGEGTRPIDGITYSIANGGGQYYRMLILDAPKPGTYTVRIIGKDVDGNRIKVFGSTTDELIVQEYQITFLATDRYSIKTQAAIPAGHHPEYLEKNGWGDPRAFINFDSYRALESTNTVANPKDYLQFGPSRPDELKEQGIDPVTYKAALDKMAFYKWPVPWDHSNYAFGYDQRFEYNMYMLANNSLATPRYSNTTRSVNGKPLNDNFSDSRPPSLYDRLFYETKGEQAGYFYFVNAATDPGVMAILDLQDLCVGSTVAVSAWVAEFAGRSNASSTEIANLAFDFIAVKKKKDAQGEYTIDKDGNFEPGERVTIHTFSSGYLPYETRGAWMHIYYTFIPDVRGLDLNEQDILRYELELENNCRSSSGADYAVDDIRVYVKAPSLTARQAQPMCDKVEGAATEVIIEAEFEGLLQTVGRRKAEAEKDAKDVLVYYAFLNKQVFDDEYDNNNDKYEAAYKKALLQYNYDGVEGENPELNFGTLKFSTYPGKNDDTGGYARYDEDAETIVFDTYPLDNLMEVSRQYYVVFYVPMVKDGDELAVQKPTEETAPYLFALNTHCSRKGVLRVQGSGIIKVDGIPYYKGAPIEVCENQSPVAQVSLRAWDKDKSEWVDLDEDAYFDWYNGTALEFKAEKMQSGRGRTLREILADFRLAYPTAPDTDVDPTETVTQDELDYLKSLTLPTGTGKDAKPAKLQMYRSSFVFAPVKVAADKAEAEVFVTASPIDYIKGKYMVCTEPTEVMITVRNHSPLMLNGFDDTAFDYPADLTSVPLRIGLRQLNAASAPMQTLDKNNNLLMVPVREITPATQGVTEMKNNGVTPADDLEPEETDGIYLIATDDPKYQHLYDKDKDKDKADKDGKFLGLPLIGEVSTFVASKKETGNVVGLKFASDAITFREGYSYSIRFAYTENHDGVVIPVNIDGTKTCKGQVWFTLKVVPEYQMWTGADSRNWNNDRNWVRMSASELDMTSVAADKKDFVTDGGTNDNRSSFAPLSFTKVVIPEKVDGVNVAQYPLMFTPDSQTVKVENNNMSWDTTTADGDNTGEATYRIEYDMAAYDKNANVHCRPWYANTCDEIHFREHTALWRQQHFTRYNKAHVDLAVTPGRWYTLASPLQAVVAGDMYLPKSHGVENSELFTEITFSTDRNDRFAPAVFQRSWNKSSAMVYEAPGSPELERNVAVELDWSNVYNDVNVGYAPGEGFSIKVDMATNNLLDNHSEARFRLPKADTDYWYYSHDGTVVGNNTTVTRTGVAGKLNDTSKEIVTTVSANEATPSRFFLVGNPYMGCLDMEEFFAVNTDLTPGYWIMDSERQGVNVFDEEKGFVGTLDGLGKLLPPMQGFFVQTTDESGKVNSINVTFTKDMIAEPSYKLGAGSLLRSPASRSMEDESAPEGIVTLRAMAGGKAASKALILLRDNAEEEYDPREDAPLLTDPDHSAEAIVYTTAVGNALAVNMLPVIDGTGIGVIAKEGVKTTVIIDGIEQAGELMLLDRTTGELTEAYDGMSITVDGPSSGRYFLVKGGAAEEGFSDTLTIQLWQREVTVASTQPDVKVRVFDTTGRQLASFADGSESVTFTLEPGIFIVEASDALNRTTRKLLVR